MPSVRGTNRLGEIARIGKAIGCIFKGVDHIVHPKLGQATLGITRGFILGKLKHHIFKTGFAR